MRTRIKICGLTRVEDVQAAVAAGADAIGLVFYPPSPRAVSVDQAVQLAAHVPAFVTLTALFVDPEADLVNQVLQRVQPGLLQFHGDEDQHFCSHFARPYIKAHRVREGDDLRQVADRFSNARALLLDAYRPGLPGGTGEAFDWSLIPENLSQPVVLAGGLNPNNVAKAIEQVRPFAVDVSGGVEAARGIKDPALIEQFVHEVGCADRR